MPRRKRPSTQHSIEELNMLFQDSLYPTGQVLQPIIELWILRLLISLSGHQRFLSPHGYNNDDLAISLGLQTSPSCDSEFEDLPAEGSTYNPRSALAKLRRLHARAEKTAATREVPATLGANASRLADKLGLDEAERRILEFTVLLHSERSLDDAADFLGGLSTRRVSSVLAIVLDLPEVAVKFALSSKGGLARCGLVTVDINSSSPPLKGKLDVVSLRFVDRMQSEEQDPLQLIRDTVFLSRPGTLARDNYPHAARELEILLPYLQRTLEQHRTGVNVLIYGPPGTGKSEMVRMLASETRSELFEVASEDEEGDPVRGENRLRSYNAAQSLLVSHRALLLFDEIEDVFNDGDGPWGRKSTAQLRKAWINRMLEENPVPTLWLTNSIRCMDQAFLRRFDMVMELGVPPRQERERIVRDHAGDLLDEGTITRIASAEALSPAVIARAAAVISAVRDDLSPDRRGSAMELLVNNTLTAQGHEPVRKHEGALPAWYDPRFVNVDTDLTALAEGLRENRNARLCLYGPPGTGKSAYGRWLADQLGMPLLVKKCSDLLDMYVGGTEQNLAAAFREASQSKSILLIDEVDSFLQDRRGARQSWEVSGVNEMLTQMDNFEGIFIASTNLMQGLDQAALRRFDEKLQFGYLQAEQAWTLFERLCEGLALDTPDASLRIEIDRLKVLTPGDFAVVARQHRFRKFGAPGAVLQRLREECALKEDGQQQSMGFV
ncbi:MAG: family ATPase [Moraxellaceae bacterium]|nr:family ATPase [Moraxellaceae bacterium]